MPVTLDHLLAGTCAGANEMPPTLIDREKVLAILRKRFPNSPADEVAAAANAIVGLRQEWREVDNFDGELECHLAGCTCNDPNWFVRRFAQGTRFKLYEHID